MILYHIIIKEECSYVIKNSIYKKYFELYMYKKFFIKRLRFNAQFFFKGLQYQLKIQKWSGSAANYNLY